MTLSSTVRQGPKGPIKGPVEASRRAAEIFLESILERDIFISFIRTWRCLSRGGGGCSRLTGGSGRRISGTQWRFCRFIRNSRKGPEPGRSGADWRSGSEGRNKAVGTISRGHRPSDCGNYTGPDLLSEHCSLLSWLLTWSGATSALCQSKHYRSGLRRTSFGEILGSDWFESSCYCALIGWDHHVALLCHKDAVSSYMCLYDIKELTLPT